MTLGTADRNSTSSSLIARARDADPQAWERLCRLYGPVIYHWALGAGLQSHDASDVMQDVFAAVATNLTRFHKRAPHDSFRGWLWTITRNRIRDLHRRRRGKANPQGGSSAMQLMRELPASPPSTDSGQGKSEAQMLWHRALRLAQSDFEPRTWEAFWRATVDEESPADVARDMGLSVWAVYKARARVLRRLREEFEGLLE